MMQKLRITAWSVRAGAGAERSAADAAVPADGAPARDAPADGAPARDAPADGVGRPGADDGGSGRSAAGGTGMDGTGIRQVVVV
jgi:hypothetical protein